MSSDAKDVYMALANEIVMSNHLTIDIINFEAAVVRFDSLRDLGRSCDEDILGRNQIISKVKQPWAVEGTNMMVYKFFALVQVDENHDSLVVLGVVQAIRLLEIEGLGVPVEHFVKSIDIHFEPVVTQLVDLRRLVPVRSLELSEPSLIFSSVPHHRFWYLPWLWDSVLLPVNESDLLPHKILHNHHLPPTWGIVISYGRGSRKLGRFL